MADKTIRTQELDNVKKATAMMFAALVDALVGTNSGAAEQFATNLNKVYHKVRNDSDDLNALEMIAWTQTMITGFDQINGQGRPFMTDL